MHLVCFFKGKFAFSHCWSYRFLHHLRSSGFRGAVELDRRGRCLWRAVVGTVAFLGAILFGQ